jgi:hypothetical protein
MSRQASYAVLILQLLLREVERKMGQKSRTPVYHGIDSTIHVKYATK